MRAPRAVGGPNLLDKIFSKDTAVHSNIGSSELPPQRDSSKWSSSPVAGRSALPERCYTGAPRGIASASDGATVALALAGSPGAQTRSLNHRPWDAFHASGNAAAPGSASGELYHSETMDRPSEGPNGSPEKLGRGPRTWAGPGRQTLLPLPHRRREPPCRPVFRRTHPAFHFTVGAAPQRGRWRILIMGGRPCDVAGRGSDHLLEPVFRG